MNLNCSSDHTINQVFLLRRQRAFNPQSGHLLTPSSRSSFLRGCFLFALFVSSWLFPLRLSSSRSSFLRGCYLIGYFSTSLLAITSRCNSFVPPPITRSGASR